MSKHTPGPWRQQGAPNSHRVNAVSSGPVAVASERFMSREERIANARLIAAAPDLLAALKDWQELRDSEGDDGRDVVEWIERVERQMRAAIAKAEGVQQ